MPTFSVEANARVCHEANAFEVEAFIARMRMVGKGEARMARAIDDGFAEQLVFSFDDHKPQIASLSAAQNSFLVCLRSTEARLQSL